MQSFKMFIIESQELTSFLDSLVQNPYDNTALLVAADWLQDRGDPLAEPIRTLVQISVTGGKGKEEESKKASEEISELLNKNVNTRETGKPFINHSHYPPRIVSGDVIYTINSKGEFVTMSTKSIPYKPPSDPIDVKDLPYEIIRMFVGFFALHHYDHGHQVPEFKDESMLLERIRSFVGMTIQGIGLILDPQVDADYEQVFVGQWVDRIVQTYIPTIMQHLKKAPGVRISPELLASRGGIEILPGLIDQLKQAGLCNRKNICKALKEMYKEMTTGR